MNHNNEFKQACQAWLQAALQLLQSKPQLVFFDTEVTFTSTGWETRTVIKPDFVQLSITYHNELINLPDVDTIVRLVSFSPTLASALLVDAAGKPVEQFETQKGWLNNCLFSKMLLEYLTVNNTFTFIPTAYERLYSQLEQYIYIPEFTGVWLVQLRNLTSDIESLQFDHTISLRRATDVEKGNAVKNGFSIYGLPMPDIPTVFLEIHQPVGRISPPDQQAISDLAQTLVLALRLLKPNPIGIASYQWSVPDQPFRTMQGFRISPQLHSQAFTGDSYVLTQEDAQILSKLFQKSKKASNKAELSTVITRFEDSYTRTKSEDKLIDYWTALEALFFLEDEFQDMGKSLALAASYYLGQSSSERRSIYNDLTRSHTLRSYYIHGERKQAKHSLDEMVTKTGSQLRNALRKRIEEAE